MPSLWEKVKAWLEETAEHALKEAEDLSKKGRIKIEILSLNRSIKERFTDLGGLVYQLITSQEKVEGNEKVGEIVGKIKSLEEELKKKEKEYRHRREANPDKRRKQS